MHDFTVTVVTMATLSVLRLISAQGKIVYRYYVIEILFRFSVELCNINASHVLTQLDSWF